MHTGMLWFDNSQTAINIKIQKGLDYYKKKYGRDANLVLIHPAIHPQQEKQKEPYQVGTATVLPYRPVLPGHIWIGIEDKE